MRNSRNKGMIALLVTAAAVLAIVGLAVAAASNESDDKDLAGFAADPAPTATTTTAAETVDAVAPSQAIAVDGGEGGSSAGNGSASNAVMPEPTEPVRTDEPDAPVSIQKPDEPQSDGSVSIDNPNPGAAPDQPVLVSTLPASELPPLPDGTHRVPAPIDGLELLVLESFPPQYLLSITAGLPSGCAKPAGFEAVRDGNTITVVVHNSEPVAPTMCTMIYGMVNLSINLGSDYESGQVYTVTVNDKTTTFTAQ